MNKIFRLVLVVATLVGGSSVHALCVNGKGGASISQEQAVRIIEKVANKMAVNTVPTGREDYLGPTFCQAVVQRTHLQTGTHDLSVTIKIFSRSNGVLIDSVTSITKQDPIFADVACNSAHPEPPIPDEKVNSIGTDYLGTKTDWFRVMSGRGDHRRPTVTVSDGKKQLECVANYLNN